MTARLKNMHIFSIKSNTSTNDLDFQLFFQLVFIVLSNLTTQPYTHTYGNSFKCWSPRCAFCMPISALRITTQLKQIYKYECSVLNPTISTDTNWRRTLLHTHRYPYWVIYLPVCFDMKWHLFSSFYSLLFV